jgi:hypothetical protein
MGNRQSVVMPSSRGQNDVDSALMGRLYCAPVKLRDAELGIQQRAVDVGDQQADGKVHEKIGLLGKLVIGQFKIIFSRLEYRPFIVATLLGFGSLIAYSKLYKKLVRSWFQGEKQRENFALGIYVIETKGFGVNFKGKIS